MTREEAIKTLKENSCNICSFLAKDMESCSIAYCDNRAAIRTLEQEPCEDCVSRECLLDDSKYHTVFNDDTGVFEDVVYREDIKNAPPVTPTHKKGKWIKTGQSFINSNKFLCYSCSECGSDSGKVKTKFYPNCGAEMKSEL